MQLLSRGHVSGSDLALDAGLRPARDIRPNGYWRNLGASIGKPFLIYVYDVPPRRDAQYSYAAHCMMLVLSILAAVFLFRRQDGVAWLVVVLIVALIAWRTGMLAFIDALTRRCAHFVPIMILLIADIVPSVLRAPRR
ncbi:MAG: hypothetical protein DWQ09_13800 [Proteobacteria bacterium]|nr:MAG: hypothetical protein DWQ09_13800 [Pseudomonadota bacterium]